MSSVLARAVALDPVDKVTLDRLESRLRDDLLHAQDDLDGRDFAVVVTLDGDDFTGCEQVYELLHHWLDARYLRGTAFGAEHESHLRSPWCRRHHEAVPPRGTIGIWLRSWATTIVTQRTLEHIDDAERDRRIQDVRDNEAALAGDGVFFVKLWITMPPDLLAKRLKQAKKGDSWRVQVEDELAVKQSAEFREHAEVVLTGTDAPGAPWHLIDGRDANARDVAVAQIIARLIRARLDMPKSTDEQRPPMRVTTNPQTMLDALEQPDPLADEDYDKKIEKLWKKVSKLTREAHARGIATVLVFEGKDAAGKGGAIRRVTHAIDAPKYTVFPIGAPDARERSRPWLWRFWLRLPDPGRVAIFDRSWYGRVLVERVEGYATREDWNRAYAEIVAFERQIAHTGAVLAKFWLHVSDEEQARRFRDRETTSFKRQKIGPEDWRNRDRAHDYELAAVEMFERTGEIAPWHVIPADDKASARSSVLLHLIAALEARLSRDDDES